MYIGNTCVHVSQQNDDLQYSTSRHSRMSVAYPNFSQLAKILRVIPTNTADPERTFSQMKLVKTKVRNRMVEKKLLMPFSGL